MTIEAHIDEQQAAAFGQELMAVVDDVRVEVQAAMAEAYYEVVYQNIGDYGLDRPFAWQPLSERYAKQVNRAHATLFINGMLLNAIKVETSNPEAAHVSVSAADCAYAVAHQYGYQPKHLPPRPYFPFDPQTGVTTGFTLELVGEYAERALARALKARGVA